MEKCTLQCLKKCFSSIIALLSVCLFLFLSCLNPSDEVIKNLLDFVRIIIFINLMLWIQKLVFIGIKKNRFKYTMIWDFGISIILVSINIYVISSMFLDKPQASIFDNLIIYMSVLFLVWIWFFHSCYKECKVAISKDNKGHILFFTKLIRTILVAIASFLLIQTNIITNLSFNSYEEMSLISLLHCPSFQKDFFYAIAYVFNCIAASFYPMIDMLVYTIQVTHSTQKIMRY